MDDSLVALGSAALTFSNATRSANVDARVAAVQISSRTFIWLTGAINMLGCVGVAVGYVVLCKANIPTFEYSDIGCVALGLRQSIAVLDENGADVGGERPWNGHPGNCQTARLAMRLQMQKLQ
jgi:hypothetical protein